MIINTIISHYHNIKIKYERQSGNYAGYLKRYTSIICSFIHQIFFYSRPLFLICYRNRKGKKTHADHAAFEKKKGVAPVFFKYSFVKMVDAALALFKSMQATRLEMQHLKNSLNPTGNHV